MRFFREPIFSGANCIHMVAGFTTFSYAVLYSSLALFLINTMHFDYKHSNGIVGFFIAANFILHFFSGQIGGRYLSNKALFSASLTCQIIGTWLIGLKDIDCLVYGFSLFLIGCGIGTTSVKCLLSLQFSQNESQRDAAFYINYSIMNVGFFIGFFVSGYFEKTNNYDSLFFYANIANIFSLLLFFIFWKNISENIQLIKSKHKLKNGFIGAVIFLLLISFLIVGMKNIYLTNNILILIGFVASLIIFHTGYQCKLSIIRSGINAFMLLSFFSMIFWMLYYTGPIGLMHFLKNNVNASWYGYEIPPQWLMNLNSFVVILGAPMVVITLNKLRENGVCIAITTQFMLSIGLIASSFLVLSIGIKLSDFNGLCGAEWVIAHYILQSLGEIFIAPLGYSMIAKLVPDYLQGRLMGFGMMISGIASSFSNHLSNFMTQSESSNPLVTNTDYFNTFTTLGFLSFISIGFLLVFASRIETLIKNSTNKFSELSHNEDLDSKKILT